MYGGRAAWALFWHVKRVMWGLRFLLHASAFSAWLLPCQAVDPPTSKLSQVLAVPLITLFSCTVRTKRLCFCCSIYYKFC
jgi:hypothetical protein